MSRTLALLAAYADAEQALRLRIVDRAGADVAADPQLDDALDTMRAAIELAANIADALLGDPPPYAVGPMARSSLRSDVGEA